MFFRVNTRQYNIVRCFWTSIQYTPDAFHHPDSILRSPISPMFFKINTTCIKSIQYVRCFSELPGLNLMYCDVFQRHPNPCPNIPNPRPNFIVRHIPMFFEVNSTHSPIYLTMQSDLIHCIAMFFGVTCTWSDVFQSHCDLYLYIPMYCDVFSSHWDLIWS